MCYAIETINLTRIFFTRIYPSISLFKSDAPYAFFYNLFHKIYKKSVKKVIAVNHINLKIREKEIVGLIGPNGSGKTTLLRILSCLIKPTEGTAKIYSFDILKNKKRVLEIISFIPGILTGGIWCNPGLSARRNLIEMAKFFNFPKERVDEALALAGLEDFADIRVGNFSSGMLAKLSIAFSLLKNSKVYLLDEPMAGVSPEKVSYIHNYIKNHLNKKLGATIFIPSKPIFISLSTCSTRLKPYSFISFSLYV